MPLSKPQYYAPHQDPHERYVRRAEGLLPVEYYGNSPGAAIVSELSYLRTQHLTRKLKDVPVTTLWKLYKGATEITGRELTERLQHVLPLFVNSTDTWYSSTLKKPLIADELARVFAYQLQQTFHPLLHDAELMKALPIGKYEYSEFPSGVEKEKVFELISVIYTDLFNRQLSSHATRALHGPIKENYIARIGVLIDHGFPIPQEMVSRFVRSIEAAPVFARTQAEIDAETRISGSVGCFDHWKGSISILDRRARQEWNLVFHTNWDSSAHLTLADLDAITISGTLTDAMTHEITHLISGASELMRVGLRIYTGNKEGKEHNEERKELGRVLNEAYTEAFSRWIRSSETPDFTNMTCRSFFEGPSDVRGFVYSDEQRFCAETLGEIPLNSITGAYFADFLSTNTPGQRARPWIQFADDVQRHVKGGFSGLAHLWSLGGDRDTDLKHRQYRESLRLATTYWQKEISALEQDGSTVQIRHGHSADKVKIEIAHDDSNQLDANHARLQGIARAREFFPLRTHDSHFEARDAARSL